MHNKRPRMIHEVYELIFPVQELIFPVQEFRSKSHMPLRPVEKSHMPLHAKHKRSNMRTELDVLALSARETSEDCVIFYKN